MNTNTSITISFTPSDHPSTLTSTYSHPAAHPITDSSTCNHSFTRTPTRRSQNQNSLLLIHVRQIDNHSPGAVTMVTGGKLVPSTHSHSLTDSLTLIHINHSLTDHSLYQSLTSYSLNIPPNLSLIKPITQSGPLIILWNEATRIR